MSLGKDNLNLVTTLLARGEQLGSQPCVMGDHEMGYDELWQQVKNTAATLRQRGVQNNDRVLLLAPNDATFAVGYYGILAAGATVVPLSPLTPPHVVATLAERSGARYGVMAAPLDDAATIESLLRIEESLAGLQVNWLTDDKKRLYNERPDILVCDRSDSANVTMAPPAAIASILFTSGTTGLAKGVELSHGAIQAAASAFAQRILLSPSDDLLITLPLSSSFGQIALLTGALLSGSRFHLLKRFNPEQVWDTLHRRKITACVCVPAMYTLMQHSMHLSEQALDSVRNSLRFMGAGGAPVPHSLVENYLEKFNLEVREGYGLTETASVTAFQAPNVPMRVGTTGPLFPMAQCRIVDQDLNDMPGGKRGEVLIGGPHIMSGYLEAPDLTERALHNGYLRTGDIGFLDDEGHLHIVDRIKDVIIRNGRNIYPSELESVLLTHHGVKNVAVLGVPDPMAGESVVAVVEAVQTHNFSDEAFLAWAATQLPGFAVPEVVYQKDAIPVGPTGKLLKQQLRNWLQEMANTTNSTPPDQSKGD